MDGLKGDWSAGSGNHEPVYDKLRAALRGHEFEPGERLMITELADRYGVSPTPVREALSRLRAEQLVGFAQGKGYSFPPPDMKELRDLYHTLGALLVFAVEDIGGTREVHRIAAALKAGRAIKDQPPEAAARARTELIENILQRIAELAGNRVLSSIAENVIARTHAVRRIDMESADRFHAVSDALHDLLQTVGRNDREAARRLIEAEREKKIDALPNLIREIVARRYLVEDAVPVMSKAS